MPQVTPKQPIINRYVVLFTIAMRLKTTKECVRGITLGRRSQKTSLQNSINASKHPNHLGHCPRLLLLVLVSRNFWSHPSLLECLWACYIEQMPAETLQLRQSRCSPQPPGQTQPTICSSTSVAVQLFYKPSTTKTQERPIQQPGKQFLFIYLIFFVIFYYVNVIITCVS